MQLRRTAERTRSRRWRSGTRRNKRHPVTHVEICPMPQVCLVHRKPTCPNPPRHPAMALRLTRCEQRWVDDVRAGRVHIHLARKLPAWQSALLALRQRINTKRFHDAGTVNASSSPTGRVRSRQPVMQPVRPSVVISDPAQTLRDDIGAAIMRSSEQVVRARRNLDISDRWYPRGE